MTVAVANPTSPGDPRRAAAMFRGKVLTAKKNDAWARGRYARNTVGCDENPYCEINQPDLARHWQRGFDGKDRRT